MLDARLHAARDDLADRRLAGQVESRRFVEGEAAQVATACAPLRGQPARERPLDSELLFGEGVLVFERRDGWAWVQSRHDGYVGYVPADALAEPYAAPSRRVAVRQTPLFTDATIKAPARTLLPFGSRIEPIGERNGLVEVAGGGWLFPDHLEPLDRPRPDPVATAHLLLGLPYVWGGRSGFGADCSGLVQLCLDASGIACPRDSDMQEGTDACGDRLPPDSPRRYGDLLFWPGHVAFALDEHRLIHATAHGLIARIEPVAAVETRVRAAGGRGLRTLRRRS